MRSDFQRREDRGTERTEEGKSQNASFTSRNRVQFRLCLVLILAVIGVGGCATGGGDAVDDNLGTRVLPRSSKWPAKLFCQDAQDEDIIDFCVEVFGYVRGSIGPLVESKRICDLNKDGKPDLVALIEEGSSYDPRRILVVCTTADGWVAQSLATVDGDMDETVADLNGDGLCQIRAKDLLSGNHQNPTYWFDVYAWDGRMYTKQNKAFLDSYYLAVYLPEIVERMSESVHLFSNGPDNWLKSRKVDPWTCRSVGEDNLIGCNEAVGRILEMMRH